MWREQVGITEMLLVYIGEFAEFQGWSSWRNVVIDILSCHEQVRRQRIGNSHVLPTYLEADDLIIEKTKGEGESIEDPSSGIRDDSFEEKQMSLNRKCMNFHQSFLKTRESSSTLPDDHDVGILQTGVVKVEFPPIESEFEDTSKEGEPKTSRTFKSSSGVLYPEHHESNYIHTNESTTIHSTSIADDLSTQFDKSYDHDRSDENETTLLRNDFEVYDGPISNASHSDRNSRHNHPCRFCTKTFTRYSYKIRHERMHTGEKPYTCCYCGKSFTQKSNKDSHERIHRGQRRFSCRFCGKWFYRNYVKNEHERSHLVDTSFTDRRRTTL